MLKNPAEYDRDTSWSKFKDVFRQLYASLLDVSAATGEFWWMNQELLKLRWGRSIDQKMAAVHGTLCRIPTRNSNQQYFSKCFTTYTSVNPPHATLSSTCPFAVYLKIKHLIIFLKSNNPNLKSAHNVQLCPLSQTTFVNFVAGKYLRQNDYIKWLIRLLKCDEVKIFRKDGYKSKSNSGRICRAHSKCLLSCSNSKFSLFLKHKSNRGKAGQST
jgi:hypothetical protein